MDAALVDQETDQKYMEAALIFFLSFSNVTLQLFDFLE